MQAGQDASLLGIRPSYPSESQLTPIGRLQVNVADLNSGELTQDDFGCHGTRLGSGLAPLGVWFMDQRLQARLLGQMIQGLPQRIGEDTDQYVSLDPPAVVMPDRPQQ